MAKSNFFIINTPYRNIDFNESPEEAEAILGMSLSDFKKKIKEKNNIFKVNVNFEEGEISYLCNFFSFNGSFTITAGIKLLSKKFMLIISDEYTGIDFTN